MRTTRRFWIALLIGAALEFGGVIGPAAAQGKDTLVFAAASLKNALDEIAGQWQRQTGEKVAISYAASNNLIKQIEQGAPADIFFSADTDWMDYGQQKGLIKPDTRTELLGNRIVLVAPKDSTVKADIGPGLDLAAALKGGRLAMASVDAVPAGADRPVHKHEKLAQGLATSCLRIFRKGPTCMRHTFQNHCVSMD